MNITEQDITLGEIGRSVDRIEGAVRSLIVQVQASMTLTAGHSIQINANAAEIKDLGGKVESLATRTAFIAGGISALISAINFFLGRH